MIPIILREDAARLADRLPRIFAFNGAIPSAQLDAWLSERQLTVPDDLKQVWQETGGGVVFESEIILSPYGDRELGENVDSENEFHRQKGMPVDWLLFHTGMNLRVIKMSSGEYASLQEGSYRVQETFRSCAEWYVNSIRKEYAARYGLR